MRALEMHKTDLGAVTLVETASPPLATGQARLKVERFSLTANNLTYAVFGDMMAYWAFFPATTSTKGRVPVWGFARVVESAVEGVPVGARVYGYFPLADELVVTPGKIKPDGFVDMADHRRPMAAVYNRCEFVAQAETDVENRVALLKPLFITGFLLDDWIASEGFFGATRVIASSASSKTALAMASRLKARGGVRVTALTSARSRGFVAACGHHDDVATYDDLSGLAGERAVYVDFAGDAALTARVHET
jgi:hypothetical protein